MGFSLMVLSNCIFLTVFYLQGNEISFVHMNESQALNARQSFIAVPRKRHWDLVSW